MTPTRYVGLAMRTNAQHFFPPSTVNAVKMLHAAIGLATEAGEIMDQIKRTMFYGNKLDRTNLVEETGDILWYAALMCDGLGISMEEVMAANIAKLRARYPDQFTTAKALKRNLKKERTVLGSMSLEAKCPLCEMAFVDCGCSNSNKP